MRSNEPALRAVRTQLQFELVQSAAEVAQAATLSAGAKDEVTTFKHRCESAAHELRVGMGRARVNPALLAAMRRMYHAEQLALRRSQAQLDTAEEREQQARSVLAGLRNQERSLDRALQAERHKRRLRQQAIDMVAADDIWLQHAWRELQ